MIHLLPGDSIAGTFSETGLKGEMLICRECLVVGDVEAEDLDEFWTNRSKFIESSYGEDAGNYLGRVKSEFDKLVTLSKTADEINLWFEYELFCQANYWFSLHLLRETKAKIFRVSPVICSQEDVWNGFGRLQKDDLRKCFENRVELTAADVALGVDLWRAFRTRDDQAFAVLAERRSEAFPYLEEVCEAAARRETWPGEVLNDITASGKTEFGEVFTAFSKRLGVYGYGDTQVRQILDAL